jgi:hypothetical protein
MPPSTDATVLPIASGAPHKSTSVLAWTTLQHSNHNCNSNLSTEHHPTQLLPHTQKPLCTAGKASCPRMG